MGSKLDTRPVVKAVTYCKLQDHGTAVVFVVSNLVCGVHFSLWFSLCFVVSRPITRWAPRIHLKFDGQSHHKVSTSLEVGAGR
jgi:hypothetical protein